MAVKSNSKSEAIEGSVSSKKAKKSTKTVKTKKKAVKKAVTKKTTKKSTEKSTKKVSQMEKNKDLYLVIDYPVENETVSGLHYAIRIGASPLGYVEIAFNDGEWQPCRYDAGFWWFDWGYFTQGNHTIQARLVDVNGEVLLKTLPRKCKVW